MWKILRPPLFKQSRRKHTGGYDGKKTYRRVQDEQAANSRMTSAAQTEQYESADFSITIPEGWVVTAGGTNIYHSIRIAGPNVYDGERYRAVSRLFIKECSIFAYFLHKYAFGFYTDSLSLL